MTQETMIQLFKTTVKKIEDMLIKKGHDYSADKDRLSNFNTAAASVQINTTVGALYMMDIKISRLANLLQNNKQPKNESIEDTAIDLITYAFLMYATLCNTEERKRRMAYAPGGFQREPISMGTTNETIPAPNYPQGARQAKNQADYIAEAEKEIKSLKDCGEMWENRAIELEREVQALKEKLNSKDKEIGILRDTLRWREQEIGSLSMLLKRQL